MVFSVFTIYITYFFRIASSSFNSSSCSWFSRIRSVNQSIIIKVQIVYIFWWAIWRNFRRVQNIKLNYWWTICRYLLNNTFNIVMRTTTLKFKIFRSNTTQCTTHVRRWNSTCIYISIKFTWLWSCVILPFNTFLSIWSQLSSIFSHIISIMIYSFRWNTSLNIRFCIILISREWSITNLKNVVLVFITCSWSSITVVCPSS